VTRKVYSVPPKVEYSLTPLGETLIPAIGALGQWAEAHLGEVEQARARYDGGTPETDHGVLPMSLDS
jgi:DNA-binding HxlR family transcriptional regulator